MTKKNDFAAEVQAMIGRSKRVMNAVVKSSIQDVVNEAQRVGPSVARPGGGNGGKMPVDTGYLRASGRASLTGMPYASGVKVPGVTYTSEGNYAGEASVRTAMGQLKPGNVFYFGWSAEYARLINMRYGFLDAAIQKWPEIVRKRVNEAKTRMKGKGGA